MKSLMAGLVTIAVLVVGGAADAQTFTRWGAAQKLDTISGNSAELNTPSLEGCPIESPDGRSLYMAANRPGGHGGLDIWVATRESTDAPWGAPVNLTAVNTGADEFCPTPVRGNGLLFVSRAVVEGVTCGLGDIYFTRFNPHHGWSAPEHLGCAPNGPNTELDEMGPSLVEIEGESFLYYSSSRAPNQPGGLVNGDIYVSEQVDHGFGPGSPVLGAVNSAGNDIQPNVRKDGLEMVFTTNHPHPGAQGGQDLYTVTRSSVDAPWTNLTNLGPAVNTAFGETRPSLSWDARTLYFGRGAAVPGTACPSALPCTEGGTGASDIYVSTRDRQQ
jgi:WD40-like Beta Propeller Repeat